MLSTNNTVSEEKRHCKKLSILTELMAIFFTAPLLKYSYPLLEVVPFLMFSCAKVVMLALITMAIITIILFMTLWYL
jgi:hypothetical protein